MRERRPIQLAEEVLTGMAMNFMTFSDLRDLLPSLDPV